MCTQFQGKLIPTVTPPHFNATRRHDYGKRLSSRFANDKADVVSGVRRGEHLPGFGRGKFPTIVLQPLVVRYLDPRFILLHHRLNLFPISVSYSPNEVLCLLLTLHKFRILIPNVFDNLLYGPAVKGRLKLPVGYIPAGVMPTIDSSTSTTVSQHTGCPHPQLRPYRKESSQESPNQGNEDRHQQS